MDKYVLVTRLDLGLIKVWAKIRKVDIEIVPDEKAPLGVTIRKGIYSLSDFPIKTIILRVETSGYERLKPFIRDL
jgi:hypothetical protein